MADNHNTTDEPKEVLDYEHDNAPGQYFDRPKGWIYKGFNFFGKETWFASPKVQLLMISIVCFLCPGMFNALGGLGGAGQIKQNANANANTALYSTFAVVGFFAGTITNRLGLRPALALGGIGYCVYAASFLCYNHTENNGFLIFAGAFLGICAGLLWCAQGAIMMSYPAEKDKGKYISWFWIIFNLGAVVGSLVPLGQNLHSKAGGVNDGTYAAFIILMFIGACIALTLCNADKVVREDSTKVILMKSPTWQSELKGLWDTMALSPWVLLLFPMFFCSNIFYTYQTNEMNGAHFNIRTRSLNGLLYWLAQIIGAVINGYLLDYPGLRRSVKAKISFGVLFALTFAIWGGGWAWQKDQDPREVTEAKGYETIDWTAKGSKYLGPMFLYFFYGFYDAIWQTNIYWYMGALSNSGRKAANLAGFYKGIQSAGAAVFWALDGPKVALPFDTIFAATWGTLGGSLLIASPLILFKIQDHVSVEEDLKFSDETYDDVVVAGKNEKEIDV